MNKDAPQGNPKAQGSRIPVASGGPKRSNGQSLCEHLAEHLRARAAKMSALKQDQEDDPLMPEMEDDHPMGSGFGQTFEIKDAKDDSDQRRALPVRMLEMKLPGEKPSGAPQKGPAVKRKQAVKKPLKTKTSKAVRAYKPGYTWNRGGRVKELRIRCLARKFLHIWTVKTFGRVLPSTAQNSHRRRILKEIFGAWNLMWWEARKEWGLNIRAELHDKYRVMNHVWKAWREYTIYRRSKTARRKIACDYANAMVQHQVLSAWKLYVDQRKEKKAMKAIAAEVRKRRLVQQTWLAWKMEIQAVSLRRQQEAIALHFWANRIICKAWVTWTGRLEGRRADERSASKAIQHHSRILLSKCFHGWVHYHSRRERKKRIYAYAHAVRNQMLLLRHFTWWQRALATQRLVWDHAQHIEHLARTARLRRAFLHWKHYLTLRREKWELEQIAEAHHGNHVVRATFAAWKLYVVVSRTRAMRVKLADQFRNQMLVLHAFETWKQRMEEKEDEGLVAETHLARSHFREVLLAKMLLRWKRYTEWRQFRTAQYHEADAHRTLVLLPRILQRWHEYASLQSWKKRHNAVARHILRERLQRRYFDRWSEEYKSSQDRRLMERMAVLHREQTLVAACFCTWRIRAQEQMEEAFKMEVAKEHYESFLCQKIMSQWRLYVAYCHKEVDDLQKAVRHDYIHRVSKAFRAWNQYVANRKRKQLLKARAQCHVRRKLLRWTLSAWQRYSAWAAAVNGEAERRFEQKNQLRLRECFHSWRENARIQRIEADHLRIAVAFHNHQTTTKVFHMWHEWSVIHAHKKQQTQLQVRDATQVVHAGILRRTFQKWRVEAAEAAEESRQMTRAATHHGVVTLRKSVRAWTAYVQLCHRKRLLQRQCQWFLAVRLQTKYLLQWKAALCEARVVHQKTDLALWHWSLQLQRKMLLSWIGYTHHRRHKAARFRDTVERRRRRLLRDGATQWLTVASDMADIRQRFAITRGAQNYHRVHQVVVRCAARWLKKVHQRRSQRGGQRPMVAAPPPVLPSAGLPQKMLHPPKIESDVVPVARPCPRRPAFLINSLKREGLYDPAKDGSSHPPMVKNPPNGQEGPLSLPPDYTDHKLPQIMHDNHQESSAIHSRMISDDFRKTPHLDNSSSDIENFSPRSQSTSISKKSDAEIPREPSASVPAISLDHLPSTSASVMADHSAVPSSGHVTFSEGTCTQPARRIELLPPTAFMFAKNGAPLLSETSLNVTHDSVSSALGRMPRDPHAPEPWHGSLNPADELAFIRNKLKEFQETRQKLKRAQSDHEQLKTWLEEQEDLSDPDVIGVVEELDTLESEISRLSKLIAAERPTTKILTQKAKKLIPTIGKVG